MKKNFEKVVCSSLVISAMEKRNWKACFLTAQKKNRNGWLTRLGNSVGLSS